MTGSRPADVTVRVRRSANGTEVEFSTRRPGVPAFRASLARTGALSQVRKALDDGLVGLKDLMPTLSVPSPRWLHPRAARPDSAFRLPLLHRPRPSNEQRNRVERGRAPKSAANWGLWPKNS
jgi:hypothetical protein